MKTSMLKTNLRRTLALIMLCILACCADTYFKADAQRSAIDTYAITNARIIPVSGPEIARGTIVIRNGLIAALGATVSAPADARVIDGTGLTVYPGLIDANSNLGMPQPAASPSPRFGAAGFSVQTTQTPGAPFAAPNSTQPPGLQPEVLAESIIQPGGEQIEAARNAGITAALTAPREGILRGQSAFINLAGETPQQMLVRSPVALHIGFTPLRTGSYPASLMGVFSALRQMLLDAARYREAQTTYERNPRGMRRPVQDKSLEALVPALTRQMPVVMNANTEREILRALDLAQEFNLRAIIAGGAESWKVADRLRQQDVPVLFSLNYPRRTTAQMPEADPEPLRVLRERVEAPKTAGRLAAARVRFAFESGQMSDMTGFLANAAKAVENGLARDEALRALTIRPAEILGVSNQLGTLEVGKIANLTVTRGDLFDRNMRISHLFIDGRPVDLKPVTSNASGAATGTWTLNLKMESAELSMTLILQQEGETLRGSLQGEMGTAQIANASIGPAGDIRFTAPLTFEGQTHETNFAGTLAGNEMRGTVQFIGRTPGTFTGTRSGGPPSATPPARTPPAQPGAQPTPQATPPAAAPDISGIWTISLTVGPNEVPGTLTLRQQGATLSGTLQSPYGTTELTNGSIGADGFRFTSSAVVEGRTIEMTLTGAVRGQEISGTVTSEIGSTSFTGTRQPKNSDK
ncbi:MAG TPA: amidohydrolase family protein [Pyrinomonadaceae bacterium]|jgi:imidazolonepropionase-like amidohydrolase